jgi:hypothetical protein
MDVTGHRHAVHLDLNDVFVRRDVFCNLAVDITRDQISLGV